MDGLRWEGMLGYVGYVLFEYTDKRRSGHAQSTGRLSNRWWSGLYFCWGTESLHSSASLVSSLQYVLFSVQCSIYHSITVVKHCSGVEVILQQHNCHLTTFNIIVKDMLWYMPKNIMLHDNISVADHTRRARPWLGPLFSQSNYGNNRSERLC